jgi:hypothetical protein
MSTLLLLLSLLFCSDLAISLPFLLFFQLAAKVALAARIDAFQEDSTGNKGQDMRDDLEKRLEKWQEPPPPKRAKALALPLDKPRKKRGGKRSAFSVSSLPFPCV